MKKGEFSQPPAQSDGRPGRFLRRCAAPETMKRTSGLQVSTFTFDPLFFRRLFGTDVLRSDEKNALLALMHKLAQGEARIVECGKPGPEEKDKPPL